RRSGGTGRALRRPAPSRRRRAGTRRRRRGARAATLAVTLRPPSMRSSLPTAAAPPMRDQRDVAGAEDQPDQVIHQLGDEGPSPEADRYRMEREKARLPQPGFAREELQEERMHWAVVSRVDPEVRGRRRDAQRVRGLDDDEATVDEDPAGLEHEPHLEVDRQVLDDVEREDRPDGPVRL